MDTILLPGLNDPFSSLSHLVGALVFLIFGVKLIYQARFNQGWAVAVTVFVVSGVFLLSMSGIYHLLEQQNAGRGILQRVDHAGIFALIAGTFTPVHTILFTGFWRCGFLILIWALAITGIILKSIYFNDLAEWIGLVSYLGLGWLGILSAYLTHRLHGFTILKPLIYGALAYTIGAGIEFLGLPVVITGVIGPHELFHIAILAGLAWHRQFIRDLLLMKQQELAKQEY